MKLTEDREYQSAMTEAQKFIYARQPKPALSGDVDSVVNLCNIVAPEMPPWAASMLASGQLAVGKLHEPYPRAITEVEDDDSIAVGISAGFFDCIYSFARPIAAQMTVHSKEGIVPPSLTRPQVIAEFRRLFELFAAGRHVSHRSFPTPIHPEQIRIADEMATFAELLVLAHEIGHIDRLTKRLLAGELDADRFAARLILSAGARLGYRMPLTGAFFAFRMYAILERFGYSFDHSHPSPIERQALLVEESKSHFGGRAAMMAKLSIIVAFDEFIESLENEAEGKGTDTIQTDLRVGVRLRAMLEEVARGRLSREKLPGELTAGFKNVPPDMVTKAIVEYGQDVASGAIAPGFSALEALNDATSKLADPLQKSFRNGLSKINKVAT